MGWSITDMLLFYVLPVIGVVYVGVYSELFKPLRESERLPAFFKILLDCPMCLGFWAGVCVGLLNWAPVAWPPWLQWAAVCGVSAIGIQYIIEVMWRE